MGAFDLPATPPQSSCGGIRSDGSYSRSEQVEIDEISVNEHTLRQNKLMSIHLLAGNRGRSIQTDDHKELNQSIQSEPVEKSAQITKVGDVFLNKTLRMTFVVNMAAHSWSREWFINGLARTLRTQDSRFRIHKEESIAADVCY